MMNLDKCMGGHIPEYMHEGVRKYLFDGVLPGSFLCAVIRNDLVGAARAADSTNQHCLHGYASVLHNAFPSRIIGCWGSEQAMEDWHAIGGLNGARQGSRSFSLGDLGEERANRLVHLVHTLGGDAEVVQ